MFPTFEEVANQCNKDVFSYFLAWIGFVWHWLVTILPLTLILWRRK